MTMRKKIVSGIVAIAMMATLMASMMLSASAAEGSVKFNDLAAEKVGIAMGDTSIYSATPERTAVSIVEKDGKKLVSMKGTMGAGDASLRIVSPDGLIDATGMDYLEFYVDASEFKDSAEGVADVPLAARFWTGGHPLKDDGVYYCLDLAGAETEGGQDHSVDWQIWLDGKWETKWDDYGRFVFPLDYKGYIRVDLAELMESICGFENQGGPGHLDKFYQIQFVFTLSRTNKNQSLYFGEFNFVNSKVNAEPLGLNAPVVDDPVSSAPAASEDSATSETPATSDDPASPETPVSSEGTANTESTDTTVSNEKTPSKDTNDSKDDANADAPGFPVGAIIGIVIGVVVVAGAIVAVVVLKKKKTSSAE